MSKALKAELVPALEAAGFSGRFPDFRRHAGDAIHFLSARYDRAGTAFFLELGAHPPGDKLTSWGEVVPEAGLLLEHVPFESRARLQAVPGSMSMTEDWFSFGGFGDDTAAYVGLASSVAGLLPQVEAWLANGQAGPNVSTI